VVDDEDIEVAKGSERAGDEAFPLLCGGEILLNGKADGGPATGCGECVGLFGGLTIAKRDACQPGGTGGR
jgi:hypothetical protein